MAGCGLKHYAAVEPRAGLENRVLATIRTEHARPYWLREWSWRFALAAVVVTGALLFLKQRAPKGALHPGDEDSASAFRLGSRQMQPAESTHEAGNLPGHRHFALTLPRGIMSQPETRRAASAGAVSVAATVD